MSWEMFKKLAVDAGAPARYCQASPTLARCVLQDLGLTAIAFRLLMKLMDYNLFATLIARAAPLMPDFQRHMKMVHKQSMRLHALGDELAEWQCC